MDIVIELFKKPMNIILMGTIITGIGALIAGYGTYRQNKSSSARNERIESGVYKGVEIGTTTNNSITDLKNQNVELKSEIKSQADLINKLSSDNTKLVGQNTDLLSSNIEISKSNKILNIQNEEMLQKVGKYQGDIEERNRIIERLEIEVNNVKQYTFYATRNYMGLDVNYDENTFAGFHTDLSNKMKEFYIHKDSLKYSINPNILLLPKINEVIKQYPKFPFAYWVKAFIEHRNRNLNWVVTAKKGVEILEITTKIEGHKQDHDNALKDMKRALANIR